MIEIFSTRRTLEEIVASASGGFSLSVTVPADIELGEHIIGVSGVSASGAARGYIFPITVVGEDGTTGGGSGTGGGTTSTAQPQVGGATSTATPAPGSLPNTGADIARLALFSLLTVGIGVWAIRIARSG